MNETKVYVVTELLRFKNFMGILVKVLKFSFFWPKVIGFLFKETQPDTNEAFSLGHKCPPLSTEKPYYTRLPNISSRFMDINF